MTEAPRHMRFAPKDRTLVMLYSKHGVWSGPRFAYYCQIGKWWRDASGPGWVNGATGWLPVPSVLAKWPTTFQLPGTKASGIRKRMDGTVERW